MFERFTDRARRVLVLAQNEAMALRHNFIGTEHILLGLISEGGGVAAKVLVQLGIDLAGTRKAVEEIIGPTNLSDEELATGKPPFTPRAKKVLELSLREALDLGHNYIGTEHLLLGLMREGEGVASQLLVARGADSGTVRSTVLYLLAEGKPSVELPPGWSGVPQRRRTHTPAGLAVTFGARAAAGPDPIGTHHYLLALVSDRTTLAGKVLESLGVTPEAVRARIDEFGTAGTTDAGPEGVETTTTDQGVVIRINDPDIAAKVRSGWLAITFTPAEDESEPRRPSVQEMEAPTSAAPTNGDSTDGNDGNNDEPGEAPAT